MRNSLFYGACTALVTPFLDNQVNYPMVEQLIKRQIDAGIRTLVLCGTTGEAPTLSDSEKLEIFRRAKVFVGESCKIIAGTGSNCTEHAIALSASAEAAGVDGLLVVSPYYNKSTEDGLYAHYAAIAQAVHIPIIVYNVPGRTGVDIPVSVYRKLSRIPNIAGVKEASTDITKIARILAACGPDFSVWTGNDAHTVPAISLGARGVISVTSNVQPAQMQAMALSALDGDLDTAASLNLRLLPLMEALFEEVNPVPVKAAMQIIGYDCGGCRLPLTALDPEKQKKLWDILK